MPIRGTMVGAGAELQARIDPSAIIGKEVGIEVNAPERADFRLMLHEPSEKVEVGLIERYVREEIWNRVDENGYSLWIKEFKKEFDEKKESIYETLITQRDQTEWVEAMNNNIALLRQLQEVIKAGEQDQIMAARNNMGFMSMGGRRGDVGQEASQKLARIFDQVAKGMELTTQSKKEANDAIEKLIRLQAGVEQALASAHAATKWDDLTLEAQAHIYRFYLNLRWKGELGTVRRNAELKVLTMRRVADGRKAPWKVFEGAERQVYEAILAWRALNEKLKAEDDPEKRTAIQEEMAEKERFVSEWTSDLTATFDGRVEHGPIGVSQIKNSAWYEVKHLIDRLRDQDGNVKKALVYTGSTYDQGSWESVEIKGTIFLQYGAARNAQKQLEAAEALDDPAKLAFIDRHFKLPDENSPQEQHLADLKAELKQKLRESARTKVEFVKVEEEQEAAAARLVVAERELAEATLHLEELQRAGVQPRGGGNQGGNNQNKQKNQGDYDEVAGAISRVATARKEVSFAENDHAQADRKALRYRGRRDAITNNLTGPAGLLDKLDDEISRLNDLIDNGGDPAIVSRITQELAEKRRKHFTDLLKKLREYIGQNTLDVDFSDKFNKRDVQIIAHLNGMGTSESKRTGKVNLSPGLAQNGDLNDQAISVKGDYAFINAWALPEQIGRLSPDILQQIFDNIDAYPEVKALLPSIQGLENKILIVTSFAVQNDIDGGMIERKIVGSGREFDFEMARRMMKENKWSEADLFAHWLDDLNLQNALGVRPEEVEARYMRWVAKNHKLRRNHFKAEDGWTFINTTVANSTPHFFETTIRRMVDAGLDLTSQAFRSAPFFQQLGKTNEYAYTVTDANMQREVHYRGEKLSANPEAPKTLLARTFRSLMKELELYYHRSLIGGQATANAEWMGADDVMKLGAFVQANLQLIERKMTTLKTIYSEIELPGADPEQILEKMVDWSEGRLNREKEDGSGLERDPGMINLTYDILDENGNFIEESANEELWVEFNSTSQYLGKLKRDLREAERNFALTTTNPHATAADIENAETEYYNALNVRRNFEIKQHTLGMQAAGRMEGMDSKEVGRVISNRYASITSEAMLRMQEQQMRATFQYNQGRSRLHPENLARRIVGKIQKNVIADWARSVGSVLGLGDRFLREEDQHFILEQIRFKDDKEIFKRAASHIAHSIQTGYQNSWLGVWHPESSDLVIKKEDANDIYGNPILDNPDAPSAQLSPTGTAYVKAIELRMRDDISDAIDRILRNNSHLMIKAAKRRGWNIDEIMKTYADAKMNDLAALEYRNGQFQNNPYGQEGTPISIAEQILSHEVRARMNRSGMTNNFWGNALRAHASPEDTRAVNPRFNNPPVATQKRDRQTTNAT